MTQGLLFSSAVGFLDKRLEPTFKSVHENQEILLKETSSRRPYSERAPRSKPIDGDLSQRQHRRVQQLLDFRGIHILRRS